MIKRLLVALDPTDFAKTAVKYACELAVDHNAEVTGLVVVDTPGIHESVGPFSPGSAHLAEKAELRFAGEAHDTLLGVLKDFEASCQEAGVSYRAVERSGSPEEIVGEVSAYYDLLVIGLRTHFHFQTSKKAGDTLEKLAKHVATAVLAVPSTYRPFGPTLESVIAFDGSQPAIRSMRQFAQNFAQKDLDIVILTAGDKLEQAKEIQAPAEEYLRAYGFEKVRSEWSPEDIISVVDSRYIDQAEVIVAGRHTKKGLFSFHVGSLPRHLMLEAKIPVYVGE